MTGMIGIVDQYTSAIHAYTLDVINTGHKCRLLGLKLYSLYSLYLAGSFLFLLAGNLYINAHIGSSHIGCLPTGHIYRLLGLKLYSLYRVPYYVVVSHSLLFLAGNLYNKCSHWFFLQLVVKQTIRCGRGGAGTGGHMTRPFCRACIQSHFYAQRFIHSAYTQ
jgi:hypothetical protein